MPTLRDRLRLPAAIATLVLMTACASGLERRYGGQSWGVSRSSNSFTGKESLRFGPYRIDIRSSARGDFKRKLLDGLVNAVINCSPPRCASRLSPVTRPFDFEVSAEGVTTAGACRSVGDTLECGIGVTRLVYEEGIERGQWRADTPFGPLRVVPRPESDDVVASTLYPQWDVRDANGMPLARITASGTTDDQRNPDYAASYSVWLADLPPAQRHEVAQIAAVLLSSAYND